MTADITSKVVQENNRTLSEFMNHRRYIVIGSDYIFATVGLNTANATDKARELLHAYQDHEDREYANLYEWVYEKHERIEKYLGEKCVVFYNDGLII